MISQPSVFFMPVLLLTLARIHDMERYARYATLATGAAARHQAQFLARGMPRDVLEGTLSPNRAVASWFASPEAARAYYFSPEYQAARQERLGAAQFEMVMVDAAGGWKP